MKNLSNLLTLVATAKTIKGTTFIGIRNYANKQGEVSNQTIIGGITYENCLLNDFKVLQEKQVSVIDTLAKEFDKAVVLACYAKVYESLEKRLSSEEVKDKLRLENDSTILRSDAQLDAFEHIAKGVKLHKETQQIHIFGLVARKVVVTPIEYKAVNSRIETIIQNKIKKLCEFKQDKYRNFIFEKAEVKMQGKNL